MNRERQILIAEDDLEDREIIFETFNELGFDNTVQFVEDGTQLIEQINEMGIGELGLIVLDLNMPRLNGTETLRILKGSKEYKQIPVIIFSTSVNEIEKKNCMDLGALEYITKPTKYAEYLETCRIFHSLAQGSAL